MAVSYRSSSSANTGSTPATSLSVSLPSGAQVNDVMLASVGVSNGGSVGITAPSGWTRVTNIAGSSDMNLEVYWHLVTGYETTPIAFTFSGSCQASVAIVDYSGAYTYIPPAYATNSTGTATTSTVTAVPNSTYTSGLSIQFFGAYNTTAQSTMTANGSYTQRIDTCTTVSQFVEVCIQDVTKSGSMGGVTSNAATISQSATSTAITIMLEAQRSAFNILGEDEFIVGGWSSSIASEATVTMATNLPNELLLCFVNIQKGSTTVSGISGGGYTWVNVGRANSNAGSCELWRTFAPVPASFTNTITFSAATISGTYLMVGIVGASISGTNGAGGIGAFSIGTSSSAAPTITVTTTRNNSWVWGTGNDPTNNTGFSVGTGQTLLRQNGDSTNVCSSGFSQQTALTATSGTNVTINYTSPSADSCNILAVEILPAINRNMESLGVGSG
jgi:hypothetical protein